MNAVPSRPPPRAVDRSSGSMGPSRQLQPPLFHRAARAPISETHEHFHKYTTAGDRASDFTEPGGGEPYRAMPGVSRTTPARAAAALPERARLQHPFRPEHLPATATRFGGGSSARGYFCARSHGVRVRRRRLNEQARRTGSRDFRWSFRGNHVRRIRARRAFQTLQNRVHTCALRHQVRRFQAIGIERSSLTI